MRIANLKYRFLNACAASALMLAFYQPAVADEIGKDFSQELNKLRQTAASVDLYLGPKDVTFRNDLDEVDVIRMACHYRTTRTEDTRALLDLLVNAGWVQTTKLAYGYDLRIVVHIHQSDSQYVSLNLTQDYSNAYARGMYYLGPRVASTEETYVEARSKIEKDLRFWASQHEALVVRPSCRFR